MFKAGAATVTLTWTNASSLNWVVAGIPFKPAAAAGGSIIPLLSNVYRRRGR